eukprot:6743938-Prymnesium_polylepis.1
MVRAHPVGARVGRVCRWECVRGREARGGRLLASSPSPSSSHSSWSATSHCRTPGRLRSCGSTSDGHGASSTAPGHASCARRSSDATTASSSI